MSGPTVTDKRQMYALLEAGAFGNTVPMWTCWDMWRSFAPAHEWWGVRTMTPGGPCRLNCPAGEVAATARGYERAGHRYQISMMVDRVATVTAWLEAWESPTGLVVEGIEHPDTAGGWTWRNAMPDPTRRKRWEGIAARLTLARHLNANSRDDLADVLDLYPGHVVELSALDRCLGTIPHRNGIVWECRNY